MFTEKRHDAVLRDINNLKCSQEFILHNLVEIEKDYKDGLNRWQPMNEMTREDGRFGSWGLPAVSRQLNGSNEPI